MAERIEQGPHRMPRRAERARRTRGRILAAAEDLFATTGYGATTIAKIAERADVAVQTVYAVFGNKRSILVAIVESRVVGDDRAVPLAERDWWTAALAETDPRRLVHSFASSCRLVVERLGPVWPILLDAARNDPELHDIVTLSHRRRYTDQSTFAHGLAGQAALRSGLSADQAADTIWAIASPEVYLQLVHLRGWTPDEYQAWLGDTLAATLLRPAAQQLRNQKQSNPGT